MRWEETLCESIQGADHLLDETPCQDAVSVRKGFFRSEPYLTLTTTDGHGHHDYPFSDRGAALGLPAAEQIWVEFMLNTRKWKSFEQMFCKMAQARWVELIRHQLRLYDVAPALLRKYGTTLLSALVWRERVYMAQLGDGIICALDWDDNPTYVVEPPSGPIQNATYSLCSSNAEACWRFTSLPVEQVKTLMLASDGLTDSFTEPSGCSDFARTLDERLRSMDSELVAEALPGWLKYYSENGSGDDISLALATFKARGKDNE